MQTKTYTIYTYDELDEKAKEKARDWYTSTNDYSFLSEVMNEHAEWLLSENGFVNIQDVKVYYSLSYSQGDGAMAEFDATYPLDGKDWYMTCRQNGHYNHYNSTRYTIEDVNSEEADSVIYDRIESICVDIFQQLEKFGYDQIEYEDSEENVAEIMNISEYTFLQDGTRHD